MRLLGQSDRRRPRVVVAILGLAVLGLAALGSPSAALAATTDIRAIRTIVTDGPTCSGQPLEYQPPCISVVVQNLGPDPYGDGSFKGERVEAAAPLRISVDIDEPTKPGLPRIQTNFTQDFLVALAPGDSVQLDFGQVGLNLSPGLHAAHLTAIALPPNLDPNPANDTVDDTFTVLSTTPATDWTGLLALGLGLCGGGALAIGRLRQRAV
jgi:hypothetical protein